MSVWQRLNAPRNRRERRVAKIARDLERERIIALLEETDRLTTIEGGSLVNYADEAVALIKGENE